VGRSGVDPANPANAKLTRQAVAREEIRMSFDLEQDRFLETIIERLNEAIRCLVVAKDAFRELPDDDGLQSARDTVTDAAWHIAAALDTLRPYLPPRNRPEPEEPF
jgi:hypothetical protein